MRKTDKLKKKAAKHSGDSDQGHADESTFGSPFHIVGLGASAGGLEALSSFFDAMPSDSGMAFVVIQHLSPDHKTEMPTLLARHTKMSIHVAEDGLPVEADRIYVIPPNRFLTIVQRKLLCTEIVSDRRLHLPIDLFFTSLARDQAEYAIGIGLSGTGSDGARGIRAIKEAGGLVMVQDEQSAKFSGMPHSAIATGLADYILPASELPHALLKFVRHPQLVRSAEAELHPPEQTMQKIAAFIRLQTGIDFSGYKQTTVVRRLQRRMGISQVEDIGLYFEYLHQTPDEISAFVNDLLISVTRFFRDREAFKNLHEKIIPTIFANASPETPIRVWVAGCATGEEAYSIAILLHEYALTLRESHDLRIFATDVNKEAIEFASSGLYPRSIAADVSPLYLSRYFVREDDDFRICRRIRDQVVFARHNILKDPPFTRMDLVSCRNLLIYLQPAWQRKVLSFLHFALRPGGYLFLGTSETAGDLQNALELVNSKARTYQKRGNNPHAAADLVRIIQTSVPARENIASDVVFDPVVGIGAYEKLWNAVNAKLISDFAPTGFVVNEKDEILYSFGKPHEFIAMPPGRANLNLLKLIPHDLAVALSTAIRRARKQNSTVRLVGVKLQAAGASRLINLGVEPISVYRSAPSALLILIEESQTESTAARGEAFDTDQGSIQRIEDLQDDLDSARDNLQTAIQQLQTSNEEFQSTNEELIASNEELQSTNEELESINEELSTLNAEYEQKNDELIIANNDLENFLRTSQIGTIVLDGSLRISKFTPVAAQKMNLLPHDTGRFAAELSNPLIQAIGHISEKVLSDGMHVEKIVEARPGIWYLLRISAYRREGTTSQGVIATILDITNLKESTQEEHTGKREAPK
jgi:two-component system CheB/CheR fusion protein